MPNVPYPYEVNWQLVTGNGSLTPNCSLSKRSLSPSLTVCHFFMSWSCYMTNTYYQNLSTDLKEIQSSSLKVLQGTISSFIFWEKMLSDENQPLS